MNAMPAPPTAPRPPLNLVLSRRRMGSRAAARALLSLVRQTHTIGKVASCFVKRGG
jgi:hypothetical protein